MTRETKSVTYKEVADTMNALRKGNLHQKAAAEEVGKLKLYVAPPQRKPLTDEEISEIAINNPPMVHEFARAIEAAHGIKENT